MDKFNKLKSFNDFLSKVNLNKYRDKYSKIKLVELDMPRNIQAIKSLYENYWDNFNLLHYEDFYKSYSTGLVNELEEFRVKTMFSEETFYRGLPARIYRTWASLLTQIQGGYVANTMYPKVEMSTELDYKGIDIRIYTKRNTDDYINIQIKKTSLSREVRSPWTGLKGGEPVTNIIYEVTSSKPNTPTGRRSIPYKRWEESWKGKLAKLDNGFVIFLPDMFALDNITVP